MAHRNHEIDPRTTMITFELNGWGRFLYDREIASSEAQVAFQRRLDDRRGIRGQGAAPRLLTIPLWEAMALYGPHVTSSFRLPFDRVTVQLPPDEGAAERIAEAVEAEQAAAKLHAEAVAIVMNLAEASGIVSSRYLGFEIIAKRVREYVNADVPRVPDAPGQWWYGDRVVEVNAVAEPCPLTVRLGNNQRKRVVDLPDEWGGPARRDPRVERTNDCTDEDIPF